MRRKVQFREIKTRFLDIILILFSIVAIVGGFGFMLFIVVWFPEFHTIPFLEFFLVFLLGLLGFRQWRKEISA